MSEGMKGPIACTSFDQHGITSTHLPSKAFATLQARPNATVSHLILPLQGLPAAQCLAPVDHACQSHNAAVTGLPTESERGTVRITQQGASMAVNAAAALPRYTCSDRRGREGAADVRDDNPKHDWHRGFQEVTKQGSSTICRRQLYNCMPDSIPMYVRAQACRDRLPGWGVF